MLNNIRLLLSYWRYTLNLFDVEWEFGYTVPVPKDLCRVYPMPGC